VAGRMGFAAHVALGHALGLPVVLMLASAYLARLPAQSVRLAWALLIVYVVQADVVMMLRGSLPFLAALHPVLALADVVLGGLLLVQGWAFVRTRLSVAGTTDLRRAA
jgi:hypothetical protein